jgi:hypothetical protein
MSKSMKTQVNELIASSDKAVATLRALLYVSAKWGHGHRAIARMSDLSDKALMGFSRKNWLPTHRVMMALALTFDHLAEAHPDRGYRIELREAMGNAPRKRRAQKPDPFPTITEAVL